MNNPLKTITLENLTGLWRKLLISFVVTLSFGYGTGMYYLTLTSGTQTQSIEENYLGNETDESALEMKFKKPEKEVVSIIHSHVISFSLIFIAMGGLLLLTSYPARLKSFLIIEPFVSIILTFGGIWLMWKGIAWMKYLIIISGSLMNLAYLVMALMVLIALIKPRRSIKDHQY
jgi:hypothetical protein